MISRNLTHPLSEEDVRALSIGEGVIINAPLCTVQDEVHTFLYEGITGTLSGKKNIEVFERMREHLEGGIIYHAAPVIEECGTDAFTVISAGPITSSRAEIYMPEIIKAFHIRAILGKGGMGDATRNALHEEGAVYVHLAGGAAVFLAEHITGVEDVFLRDRLGDGLAMWVLTAKDLPGIVTIDSKGESLHARVQSEAERRLAEFITQ